MHSLGQIIRSWFSSSQQTPDSTIREEILREPRVAFSSDAAALRQEQRGFWTAVLPYL